MGLGGGSYTTQNKNLPGTYINFASASQASSGFSDRGIAAIGLELDWGVDGEIFEVKTGDFKSDSVKLFGYEYSDEKLMGLRELFKNTRTLYAYRLNQGSKASNEYATALHSGLRGNDLKITISMDLDGNYTVKTLLGASVMDTQTATNSSELLDNDFVVFKKETTLIETVGAELSGGTNGIVDGSAHQKFLDKIGAYTFNTIGVVTTTENIKSLYVEFTKRMRDEVGSKFQCVVHDKAADYEGVVNVKNKCVENTAGLVYWVTGVVASCEVNKSNQNRLYNGEFTVNADYTQAELEQAMKAAEFILHKVSGNIRILADINSLKTFTDVKGAIFQDNQTIRVIDQIANDIALLFAEKYIGNIPNDESGRISLWSDIVQHHQQLQDIRAIENFSDSDVVILQGNSKKSVVVSDSITIINTMSQLYMAVEVQ
jgi:Phage tail sheath protein.